MWQQTIDDRRIDFKKALEDGINGAISSAIPRLSRNYYIFSFFFFFSFFLFCFVLFFVVVVVVVVFFWFVCLLHKSWLLTEY